MNYGAPVFRPAAPAAVKSNTPKIIVAIIICFLLFVVITGTAIALGVGLGVGLTRNSNSNSASASASTSLYSILSPPTVTCTYSGSSTCGCAATKPSFLSPRIIQGYTAVTNSWPWIVELYLNNNKTLCGGFLISYQYVVTAAHCLTTSVPSSILVYAGLQQLSARSSAQVRTVANFTVHPSYSATTFANDIAVVALTSPFAQTTAVGLCCLASDTSLPSLNEKGVIAGWGVATASSSTPSNDLLQGVVKVQADSSSCSTPSTSSIQFCASYSGTDSCFGDSGAPFMSSSNNAWTCTGIVSAGRSCGQNSLYTRVSAFRTFIRDNTGV